VTSRAARLAIAFLGILIFAGFGVSAFLLLRAGDEPQYRGSEPPAAITLPNFSLPDQSGRMVSSKELGGKVVAVTFLDSQCTESCPIIASQIARTLERFPPEARREVAAIAISTDPEEDTPESVQSFLAKNRAERSLRYLVAPVEQLRPVWSSFHISASFDTGIDTVHSAPVRIFDREGMWVSTLHAGADLTSENLAHDLNVALSG
jgi:cytochrome oxidase Cu insertion factor (SCO1/SenC/PrrC family)